MTNKILFITAFKDIGRSNWNKDSYQRTTETYLQYFNLLIKNNFELICFCEDDIKEIIHNKFNFKNTYPYDKENTFYKYYEKQKEIMYSKEFKKLIEHRKNSPECNSVDYNIVNHNKIIFLNRAKELFPNYTHYAWIDFGYTRNEDKIIKDFDFSILDDKIYIASMIKLSKDEICDPIQNCINPTEIIQGSMYVVPKNKLEWMLEVYNNTLLYFENLNIVDDDQAILLYIYKENIDKFNLYVTKKWFELIRTLRKRNQCKKIGFLSNQLCERGTTIALYDYAYYNQKLYDNDSIIFYQKNNILNNKNVIYKFENEFKCYEFNDFSEVEDIIKKENIQYLYQITSGKKEDSKLSTNIPNLIHAVFNIEPHGEKYACVSEHLVKKYNSNVPFVPHMINLPITDENFRQFLNIPYNSIVFGRYGGFNEFNISFVHEAIKEILEEKDNYYFLFANTQIFLNHPRIIYIDKIINLLDKSKFINTCDVMIHARIDGETFGLSIGEFSTFNKPIITNWSPYHNNHLEILKDNGIVYHSKEELMIRFRNIPIVLEYIKNNNIDINMYKDFTPEKIMKKFMEVFID